MASVPYSPVPNVAPSVPGLPRVGIETPPAAFGAATAAAVRGLGQQTEQSANEMFGTAMYVQQLKNETWAKNEFVNQSSKLGQIESDFYSLKGQAAVNAMPKYANDVRGLYESAIANAPNPQAARFLGDSLSRRISYSLVDGQRHAGQQTLAAAGDASISTVAMGLDEISKRPQDDEFFNDTTRRFRHEADIQESLGNGKAEANLLKWNNMAWESRFEALYGKPDQAQALYDRLENDIPPAARQKILQNIRSSESTVRFNNAYATAQSKADAEAAVSDISSRNRIINPATGQAGYGPGTIKELTDYAKQNPSADKEIEERLKWVRQANEDAAKGIVVQTNPEVLSSLTTRMFDATNPTSERDLAKAENDRSLSTKDRDWLANTIKLRGLGDAEALKDPLFRLANDSAKAMIEGTSAADRAMNAGNYAAFQYQFLTDYLKAKQEGTLKPGDLDMGNPDGFLRKTMEQYVPGIGKTIRGNGGVGATPVTPAAPAAPAAPSAPASTPVTINSKAEYDLLKPGTQFSYRGKGFVKPEGSSSPPQAAM